MTICSEAEMHRRNAQVVCCNPFVSCEAKRLCGTYLGVLEPEALIKRGSAKKSSLCDANSHEAGVASHAFLLPSHAATAEFEFFPF